MAEKEKVDIGKIAKDLQLDRPVMSTRVVGSRVEIYLLGGEVVWWPAEKEAEEPAPDPSTHPQPLPKGREGGKKADKERPKKGKGKKK